MNTRQVDLAMPLILITGLPSSGKSRTAAKIHEYFAKKLSEEGDKSRQIKEERSPTHLGAHMALLPRQSLYLLLTNSHNLKCQLVSLERFKLIVQEADK